MNEFEKIKEILVKFIRMATPYFDGRVAPIMDGWIEELGEKSVDIGRSSGSTPTDIKVGTESTDSIPLDHNKEDLKIDIFLAHETDKAYLIENDKRLQSWIPKKATVDINIDEFNIGSIVIAHWFKDKIKFAKKEA